MSYKFNHNWLILAALAVIFVGLNIILFGNTVPHLDFWTMKEWGETAYNHGLSALYLTGQTDYPPLYLYVLKFNAFLTQILANNSTQFYLILAKLWPAIFHLSSAILIYLVLKKKKIAQAGLAFFVYLLNPGLIYDYAYWGQIDAVYSFFLLLGVILLVNKKYLPASLLITLAILIKYQSVVLLPLFLVVYAKDFKLKQFIRLCLLNLLLVAMLLLPYSWAALQAIVRNYQKISSIYPYVTMNAFNFWYLFSRQYLDWQAGLPDTLSLAGISLRLIGYSLFGLYVIMISWLILKDKKSANIYYYAAALIFGFFMLLTQMHERYLYPIFGFLALIVWQNKKMIWLYAGLSFNFFVNLSLIFPYQDKWWPFSWWQQLLNSLYDYGVLLPLTIVISLVNVVIFAYFSYYCINSLRRNDTINN